MEEWKGRLERCDTEELDKLHDALEGEALEREEILTSLEDALLSKEWTLPELGEEGATPLHWPILRGSEPWLRFLLEVAEQLDLLEEVNHPLLPESGRSLAHLIVESEHEDQSIALLYTLEEYGGECSHKNKAGLTPLHVALLRRHHNAIDFLASHFEFQKDREGLTALEYAALDGNINALELLTEEIGSLDGSPVSLGRLLHCACFGGHVALIQYLIDEYDVSLLETDRRNGRTCLHYAVSSQGPHLKTLLDQYPDLLRLISVGDKVKRTPLHLAAENNQAGMCRILLSSGADPLDADNKGLNAFHYAAGAFEGYEAMQELLSHVDLSGEMQTTLSSFSLAVNRGRTPKMSCLHIAASRGNEALFCFLLQHVRAGELDPNALDRYRNSLFFYLVRNNMRDAFTALVEYLLEHQLSFSLHRERHPLLHRMVQLYWELDYFTQLRSVCPEDAYLQALQSEDESGLRPLHMAAACGHTTFLRSMLPQVDQCRDRQGHSCAHYAAYHNQQEALLLIQQSFSSCFLWKNEAGQLPVHMAAAGDAVELLVSVSEFLLQVYERDLEGHDPFLLAAQSQRVELLQLLWESGADPQSVNHHGESFLHRMMMGPASRVLPLLRALEGLPGSENLAYDAQDQAGRTPLHVACQYQRESEILDLLLARGTPLNQADQQGNTALHYCAFYGNHDYLKRLLTLPTLDLTAKNHQGRTVLDTAAWAGQAKVVRRLIKAHSSILCSQDLYRPSHGNGNGSQKNMWRTPLHAAAMSGDMDTLEILSAHFDLQQCDGQGRSPLRLVLPRRDKMLVLFLLSLGAVPSPDETEFLLGCGWQPEHSLPPSDEEDEEDLTEPEREEEESHDTKSLPLTHDLSPSDSRIPPQHESFSFPSSESENEKEEEEEEEEEEERRQITPPVSPRFPREGEVHALEAQVRLLRDQLLEATQENERLQNALLEEKDKRQQRTRVLRGDVARMQQQLEQKNVTMRHLLESAALSSQQWKLKYQQLAAKQ